MPMLLRSSTLLALLVSIFLLLIYLAKWFNNFLIFLESNARYSSEPWREIDRKLLFHKSGLIGLLRSYDNWILMMMSSTHWLGVEFRARVFSVAHYCLTLFSWSVTLLTWFPFPLLSLQDSWELLTGFLNSSSERLLKCSIFS